MPSATSVAPGKVTSATFTPPSAELAAELRSRRYVVANQLAHRLEISTSDAVFALAPLERRLLTNDQLRGLRDEIAWLEGAGYVAVEPEMRYPGRYFSSFAFIGSAVIACLIYGALTHKPEAFILTVAFVISLLGLAGFIVASKDRREEFKRWLDQQPQRVAEFASLALVLFLSVALPGMAILMANGLEIADVRRLVGGGYSADVTFAVGLRFFFIVALSMVPAVLYFSFDREELATLRAKFIRQILRFDREVGTVAEVNARYGRLMDEAYGRETATGRLVPTRRSPVLIATVVIALGWLATIELDAPPERFDESDNFIIASASDLLRPDSSPLAFAFLGAYFFALNAALRGYLRGDLRPKTYSQITVRILVVAVLGLVLGQLFGQSTNPALLAFAFLAGIVPETALVRIQEFARGRSKRPTDEIPLAERHPLTRLEGIDIYDRARLMEEGVTNVEALAHHDLIDLMLKTRIPVPRLIDWVDQAVLYLHADDESRRLLRKHGVRTATDLESTYERARLRQEEERFLEILPSGEGAPSRVRVILDAISDEEWMRSLRDWRNVMRSEPDTIRYSRDSGLLRPSEAH